IAADRQAAGDMRQRNINDRRVQHLHEGAQGHDDGDKPRVRFRLPRLLRVAHRTVTVGVTEIPSGRPCPLSRPLSMMILTGTRRTILTKFPVAFSAGNAEKRAPLPSWMLSTWPCSLRFG